MAEKKLNDSILDTLKDIYFAERQVLKNLPKMAKAAKSAELKKAFLTHRDQTEQTAILRALHGCMRSVPPITVPSATQGNRTGYHVLSKRPEFPESLRSAKRFSSPIATSACRIGSSATSR